MLRDFVEHGTHDPEEYPFSEEIQVPLFFFLVSDPLCLSSSSAFHFFQLFFSVHHLVNQDDRHLLAHAMCNGL
jgi:hypothetical protein